MRRMSWAVLALLLAAPAWAAEGGRGWSVLSGSPVGASHVALEAQAGWPDLAIGGLLGLNDKADVGVRFAFDYGQDGSLWFGSGAAPGFRLQAVGRYALLDAGALRIGAWCSPGFGMDFLPGDTTARVLLPLGLTLALAPSEALALHAGVDLAMYVTPGLFGGLTLPILLGGGAEYHLDRAFAVTARVRLGPAIELSRPGAPSHLVLQALAGTAYRF